MLVHLRRVAAVVAVVLVGLGLVVLDPSGPSAMAYTTVPAPPLSYMPAQTTQSNTLTPNQWNATFNSNPNRVISNTGAGTVASSSGSSTGTSKLGAGGMSAGNFAFSAVTGLNMALDLGTGVSTAMGLPTTGNFWCDLGTALATSDCALGPATGYEVNAGFSGLQGGWQGGVSSTTFQANTTFSYNYWQSATISYRVDTSMTYATTWTQAVGQQVAVQMAYSGQCISRGSSTTTAAPQPQLSALFQDPKDPTNTVSAKVLYPTAPASCGASGVASATIDAPSNSYRSDWVFAGVQWLVSSSSTWTQTPVGTMRWVPEGHPSYTPGTLANPQRWWQTTWKCSTGTPGGVTRSAAFTEADEQWPAIPQAQCDASAVVTSVLVEQITEGLTAGETIYTWEADQQLTDFVTQYPQCVGGGCTLLLERLDAVTGARYSCFDNPTLCTDWFNDPAKTETYRCTYGGAVVDLAECNVYRPTFDPGVTNGAGEAIDYADPDGKIDTTPGTGTSPQPGGGTQSNSCPPPFSWTSAFNPWYYYKASVCALQEAFVPVKTQAKITQITTTLQTKTPLPQLGSIVGVLTPPQGGSLCLQLSLPLTFVIGHDQPLLDSCTWSDPVSRLLRDYRPLFSIAMWVMTLAPFAWWAWKTYAPGSTGTA
ncbi:hypothetical protein [Cellulomonas sp. RIT-PI-Y]|uniref:hypothetical protein n=1 Tax=Cellulomonas sp. RIT-PI-Y TaxID=3035297 RepID=UPI0021D98CB2|nr:hypothetical protein [Cellulomonas sp. RIT-PI-Y]